MTLTNNSPLNNLLNQIHRWSEPGQHPMTRMFLTRAAEVPCTTLEVATIAFKTLHLGLTATKLLAVASSKMAVKILPDSKLLQQYAAQPFPLQDLKAQGKEIGNLVVGLISTIFLGVFFSPESNFKVHLKLGLITDNKAEKDQKALAAKLQMELQKAEITKARNERFAKLEAAQQAAKDAEAEAYAVNSRLAELLLIKV